MGGVGVLCCGGLCAGGQYRWCSELGAGTGGFLSLGSL